MTQETPTQNTVQKIVTVTDRYVDYGLWGIGTAAIFGSLYYSEIAHLIPCLLCWWQRIMLYPVAFIMTVGILRKDRNAPIYVLPLATVGLLISGYHSLLQWGVITETVLDCSAQSAVSCSKADIDYFGFVTIPFMAFVSCLIAVVLSVVRLYSLRLQK